MKLKTALLAILVVLATATCSAQVDYDYRVNHAEDVGSGTTTTVSFATPSVDIWPEFSYYVATEGLAQIGFYEGATVTVTGTSFTPLIVDRNASVASTMLATTDPGVAVTLATTLDLMTIPGGKYESNPWILNGNTTYAIIVTDKSGAANEVSIQATWKER